MTRWSQLFLPTLRDVPKDTESVSHRLMLRAGLIRRVGAGAYAYLPLGLRVLARVERILREELAAAGAQELLMPALHPPELWQATGRYALMRDVLFKVKDRHGKELLFGPTHEEVVTSLVAGEVKSYKQLPLILYQIQTKFRDEPRPRFGIIRTKEFLMKDAYSFDADEAGLERSYRAMYAAYERIFRRCGLTVRICEADTGVMGGSGSHEFMAPAEAGEDFVAYCAACGYAASLEVAKSALGSQPVKAGEPCPKCRQPLALDRTIEAGHVFKLGTRYSAALNAVFQTEDGRQQPMIMGCYGIGVNRIIACAIEQHHDEDGIIWPEGLAPFDAIVTVLDADQEDMRRHGEDVADACERAGLSVLLDDRPLSPGAKLKDADLVGIPRRVVVGKRGLATGQVEISRRDARTTALAAPSAVSAQLMKTP